MSTPRKIPYNKNQDRAHKRKRCIDCVDEGISTARKAPHPGPRCATHHRAKRVKRNSATREQRWQQVYSISAKEYWSIWDYQGGCCYICRRAKGTGKRRLSVDHCHETGIVRGLLCQPCNRNVLGHARDDTEFFERCIDYLTNPPAVDIIGERIVPDMKG